MSSICAALLDQAGTANLQVHWQQRVRFLSRSNGSWFATDDSRTFVISSSRLVLSGSLLAHPRSLAMLDWQDVPLRVAVTQGTDPSLDLALQRLALSESDVRWNLMLEIAVDASELPRQIRLTPRPRNVGALNASCSRLSWLDAPEWWCMDRMTDRPSHHPANPS